MSLGQALGHLDGEADRLQRLNDTLAVAVEPIFVIRETGTPSHIAITTDFDNMKT